MNLFWLTAMTLLLAANAIDPDESDAHFLDLVRKKAQTKTGLSEEDLKMDDSTNGIVEKQDGSSTDTSKRTSSMAERNQPVQAPDVELRQSRRDMKKDLSSRRCTTLSCRLQYVLESDKDDNQLELSANNDKRVDDGRKTREKVLSKKTQGRNIKRCLAWGCKRRSLEAFKIDRTATQDNDEMKEEALEGQERRGVKRQEKELRRATNVKKRVPRRCLAWHCKEGKRTPPVKRSGVTETSKRIVSRKPDDLIGLFGSSRGGKCRGLECLTKRTRDATVLSRKNEMPSGCITWECYGKRVAAKKEPGEKIDAFKRIINRKNDNDRLGLTGEKCRGWECIMKDVFHDLQNDKPVKCLSWECDYKRRADPGESTETQKDINAGSHEKDASQYDIPDEYQRPIRRDALRRISPYSINRGPRSNSRKQDI